ncbi:DciA family protein [Micromonospora sp. C95]|uniref:DUF721 domain-containing protein n=1 Tax=Micromonospora sp. C95 TaxID=2824882 RepID=UPI0027DAF128|nr:DciA family protein [Micromonospora sp. C95]
MPTEPPQPDPDSAPSSQPRGVPQRRGARTAGEGGTGDGGRTDEPAGRPAEPTAAAPTAQSGDGEGVSGPQLARAVLDAAKARREAAGRPRRRAAGGGGDGERRLRGYSGPGPDPRDPQPLGAVLNRLVKARGWQQPAAEATVFGAWERVVGAEVAQHSRPVKLENGELTVEARSTAWATQLRLLAGSLLQQIAREVGHNVVRKLHIHGPAAPSWSRGPRRVRGRGPRDTYG